MKKATIAILLSSIGIMSSAQADDWGCEVLLCLSNPAGWAAVAQCVPPINKLWRELAKGNAFPSCAMASAPGNNNSASMQWASQDFCPPQYILYRQNDGGPEPYCGFAGAIQVTLNNKPYRRVWWNGADSVTEYLTPEAKGGSADNRFERDYAAWKVEQDRLAKLAAEAAARDGGN